MTTFEHYSAPRIIFGRGQASRLGELAAQLGTSALVVHSGGGPGEGGMVDRVTGGLAAAGVNATYVRQRGEPQIQDVDRALDSARAAGCDLVIGLGGGSAIDAAKAAAGLLANGGAALDYMEVIGRGQKITRPAAPWVAVPTTAGTGAEVTRNAVIGDESRRFKASIRSEDLLPRVALVDPELGVTVPPEVTARSGMDALCQLIESYTSAGAQPMTDALALQGITLAGRSLPRAYRDGRDLDAREDMALAALLSGITLTNAGLGAVHGFAAPLGANYPAPHGAICAVLLPGVMAANVEALRRQSPAHPTLARYAAVGRIMAGDPSLPDGGAIEAAAAGAARLVRDLDIPRLGRFGLEPAGVPEMVALARKASSMRFNPVTLSDAVLGDILAGAI
jgi:alcohol dehydrogenase class IV